MARASCFFFSLSGSKLPGYILPALPGAWLLVGERVAKFARGEGGMWSARITGALFVLAAVGIIVYAVRTNEVQIACALIITLPIVVAGAINVLLTRFRRLCFASIVVAVLAAIAFIVSCAAEGIARKHSVRELLRAPTRAATLRLPSYTFTSSNARRSFTRRATHLPRGRRSRKTRRRAGSRQRTAQKRRKRRARHRARRVRLSVDGLRFARS